MEVRFESMVFLWDDKIPTMFLEFMNLLTLCQSEEQLRASVKDFAEKHELDKFLSQTGIGRRKRTLMQYDYRHTDGELFSCVKPTLDECRAARDKWLTAKERKEDKR